MPLLIELSPADMQAWKLSSSEVVECNNDQWMMTSLSEVRTLPLTVYGTAFGDNSGAIELAKVPKMYPRTKHVNPKNHHFRAHGPEGVDPGRLSSGVKPSSVSCAS
jgi:hypothetical protein